MKVRSLPMAVVLLAAVAFILPLPGCGAPEAPPQGRSSVAPPAAPAPQGVKDLPATAYQLEWGAFDVPATIKAGDQATVQVTVKNTSPITWPSGAGTAGLIYTVRLGDRWLKPVPNDAPKEIVTYVKRVELPPLKPGETATVADTLTAPAEKGRYLVQFDLVHEGVTWFADKGAPKKLSPVTVN